MRIAVVVDRKKERLAMPGDRQAEDRQRRDDEDPDLPERRRPHPVDPDREQQAEPADNAVVDHPGGDKPVAVFARVGVTAARAAVERHEQIIDLSRLLERHEERGDPALGAFEAHRTAEVELGPLEIGHDRTEQ